LQAVANTPSKQTHKHPPLSTEMGNICSQSQSQSQSQGIHSTADITRLRKERNYILTMIDAMDPHQPIVLVTQSQSQTQNKKLTRRPPPQTLIQEAT